MQTREELLELIKTTIRGQGKYLRVKDISLLAGVSYSVLYRVIPEGITGINESLGFYDPGNWNTTDLTKLVTDHIRALGTYCTAYELSKSIKVSRSTFKKHGLNIPYINKGLGLTPSRININRPVSAGFNKLSEVEVSRRLYSIVDFIKTKGISCTYKEIESSLKLPQGFKKRIHLRDLHEEAGVLFIGMKRYYDTNTLRQDVICLIEKEGRYTPSMTIAERLGVTTALLHHRGINTQSINESLGFVKDNGFFEYSVYKVLEDIFPNRDIVRQKWFKDCLSSSGNPLYFDFYIRELNLLIEADGPGHFDKGHPWYTEIGIERDAIKNKYIKNEGIILCRVPYNINVTREYVLQQLSGTSLEIDKLQHS